MMRSGVTSWPHRRRWRRPPRECVFLATIESVGICGVMHATRTRALTLPDQALERAPPLVPSGTPCFRSDTRYPLGLRS
jgi:hypothetical protein